MEHIIHHISKLYESTQNIIEQHIKVAKLETYERVTNLISSGVNSAIILLVGLFAFTFLNLSGAYFLSEYLNSKVLGFLFVGLGYTVLLIIYAVFQKSIVGNGVKNIILAKISKDIDNYDELLEMQKVAYADIEYSKASFKSNVEAIKDKVGITALLNINKEGVVQSSFKKILIVALIRLGVNKILLRNTNPITKFIVQFASDASITSSVFNGNFWGRIADGVKSKFREMVPKQEHL